MATNRVCYRRLLAFCFSSVIVLTALKALSETVYVLDPGLPLIRHGETSVPIKGNYSSLTAPWQALQSAVPWSRTAVWSLKADDDVSGSLQERVQYFGCDRLIAGIQEEVERALEFMARHDRFNRSDDVYIRETRDCKAFVRNRGYILEASDEEKEFPLAFSILFYRDLEQVERLLRAIYRPHNVYCLHLDAKSDPATLRAVKGLVSCLKNVFLASRSTKVDWGDFTVLEAELICMQDLWNKSSWKYYINLTGQEFPLKTNQQIVQILKSLNGSNDVDATTHTRENFRWENVSPPPHGIQPVKGNVHAALSRGFVDFALHSPLARDLLAWVRQTEVPDETFFSTLNHNPHLHVPGAYLGPPDTDPVVKPYLSRYKNWGSNWKDGRGRLLYQWPCRGVRVRNICIFGLGDLPALTSRKELVANKLHLTFEPLGLECLEEWLWNMTLQEYAGRLSLNLTFYRTLDVVKNHYVGQELRGEQLCGLDDTGPSRTTTWAG